MGDEDEIQKFLKLCFYVKGDVSELFAVACVP
jgi:hypothetical protein